MHKDIQASSGIQTHDPSVLAGEESYALDRAANLNSSHLFIPTDFMSASTSSKHLNPGLQTPSLFSGMQRVKICGRSRLLFISNTFKASGYYMYHLL
jgi:hypothetical protein